VSEDSKKNDIVPSGLHSLVKSSSGLVRRGLDDLLLLGEKKSVEENSLAFWLQRGCDLIEEAVREEANREVGLAPQRAEAVSCFEKAIEIDAYCKEAWVLRAGYLEGLWRWRETVESLDKAIEIIRAGRADYNPRQWHSPSPSAVIAYSDASQLSGWKARLLQELGRFEEAIPSCDLALQLSPDANSSFNANCWELRGTSLNCLGRHEEAIQCFDRVIAILTQEPEVPQHIRSIFLPGAWTSKGMSLYRLGRWKESMECYDMAISIQPESSSPWYCKGDSFREMKNFDEALRCYNKAIELEPEHARSWFYKGVCLRELGRLDEAISCHEKVMSCRLNLFWYEAGLSLEGRGRTKDAIDAYEAYLAVTTPDEAIPSEMNFIEKAREHLQVLKLRPELTGPERN
jgi:tetratricopeptide (TPR) repeat protein